MLLSHNLSCPFLPNYTRTVLQKLANGIYQYLVSYNCFQTKRSLVLSSLLIYLSLFSSVSSLTKSVSLAKLKVFLSYKKKERFFNSLLHGVSFLYPLKILEILPFSDVFRRYKKGTTGSHGLNKYWKVECPSLILMLHH